VTHQHMKVKDTVWEWEECRHWTLWRHSTHESSDTCDRTCHTCDRTCRAHSCLQNTCRRKQPTSSQSQATTWITTLLYMHTNITCCIHLNKYIQI